MLKKSYKIIVVGLVCLLCMNSNLYAEDARHSEVESEEPFDVQLKQVEVMQDTEASLWEEGSKVNEENDNNYLSVRVTIENKTDNDFQNVSFKLTLNKEVEPFIATQILEYDSEKMDVTSEEKAGTGSLEQKDDLLICGFDHT